MTAHRAACELAAKTSASSTGRGINQPRSRRGSTVERNPILATCRRGASCRQRTRYDGAAAPTGAKREAEQHKRSPQLVADEEAEKPHRKREYAQARVKPGIGSV